MNINLEKWLKFKNTYSFGLVHYPSQYTKDAYYIESNTKDIDIKNNDVYAKTILDDINKYESDEIPEDILDKVKFNDHILLDPKTNHFHVNMLLRQLIDYTFDSDFCYNGNIMPVYLFDKYMKTNFYKFCKKYS